MFWRKKVLKIVTDALKMKEFVGEQHGEKVYLTLDSLGSLVLTISNSPAYIKQFGISNVLFEDNILPSYVKSGTVEPTTIEVSDLKNCAQFVNEYKKITGYDILGVRETKLVSDLVLGKSYKIKMDQNEEPVDILFLTTMRFVKGQSEIYALAVMDTVALERTTVTNLLNIVDEKSKN